MLASEWMPGCSGKSCVGLIKDIEDHERFKVWVLDWQLGEFPMSDENWWKERFPLIPEGVLEFMVGQSAPPPDGDALPWNRRQRKRFLRAKALVIHLYAGDESSCKDWETGWPPGVE